MSRSVDASLAATSRRCACTVDSDADDPVEPLTQVRDGLSLLDPSRLAGVDDPADDLQPAP